MNLHPTGKLPPGPQVLVCRQSRLVGTLGTFFLLAFLIGGAVFWWVAEAPWFVWGSVAALALLLTPVLLSGVGALYRRSNWVLLVGVDRLWINLRSHENHHFPQARTVVELPLTEIEAVGSYQARYATPQGPGARSTHHRLRALDVVFKPCATEALVAAIDQERTRPGPTRSWLVVSVRSRSRHVPVSFVPPSTIRIAWRGGKGHHVTPALEPVLEVLSRETGRLPASDRSYPDWQQLSGEQLDELAAELARSGDLLGAAKLLVRRRGLSLAEAKQHLERLQESPRQAERARE